MSKSWLSPTSRSRSPTYREELCGAPGFWPSGPVALFAATAAAMVRISNVKWCYGKGCCRYVVLSRTSFFGRFFW